MKTGVLLTVLAAIGGHQLLAARQRVGIDRRYVRRR